MIHQPLRAVLRAIALGSVLALLLVACGQKPGVHVEDSDRVLSDVAVQPQTATPEAGETATVPDTADTGQGGAVAGESGGGNTDGDAEAGTTTTTTTTESGTSAEQQGSAQGDSGGGSGDSAGQQQSGNTPPGNDRTGAEQGDPLTVGIHAPVTGAAPLPAESFREAKDLYWRWQIEQKGRTIVGHDEVEVLFRDDKYNPASARQVCRELSKESFLVVGGGGTDQIQTCGQLAEAEQFPYFSAGVTEAGLTNNAWYYAASMTYRQQGTLLAQYIKKRFGNARVGAIITNSRNFDDAESGFRRGVQQAGINLVEIRRHPKGDDSWKTTYVNDFSNADIEVVYMLMAPTDYIEFAKQGADQQYNPHYVGVGVSMGLNAVLEGGCDEDAPDTGIGNGTFFSPFPALEWARNNEKEFFRASERFGTVADDLALALWGTAKQQDLIFRRYQQTFGNDLTREAFRGFVEQQDRIVTGLFPEVGYSPDDHFGGRQVHVLEADCSDQEYDNVATFQSGF